MGEINKAVRQIFQPRTIAELKRETLLTQKTLRRDFIQLREMNEEQMY